jgi:arginase
MTPQYFALHSRLGLQHPPIGASEANIGVEDAPTAVLDTNFLEKFPGRVTPYVFPPPSSDASYWQLVQQHSLAASKLICTNLQANERQVVVGGDHSVTFASLHALAQRTNLNTVGYIQIDAHPDLNTVTSSPTGNFHGMYVRAAVEQIGIPTIDTCFTQKLPVQNIWYFGNLSIDPEEQKFLSEAAISCTSVHEVRSSWQPLAAKLTQFISNFQHIHITFDIDSMDTSIAPATGIPCKNGFLLTDALPLLSHLTVAAKNWSFDLVEVNPRKLGALQTIATAQTILATVLTSK